MVNIGMAAIGIILALIAVGGLLYTFYSRTNAVEKTGYGALTMLALVSLMIPVLWILESGGQAEAKAQQHIDAVQRGMMLYVQYCVDKCYAVKNGQIIDPKYNGYTIDTLNKLTDDDLKRVIDAGVYNPSAPPPSSPNDIVSLQKYGGPLSTNDADYVFEFIRSADRAYLSKNGYTGESAVNAFTKLLPNYLQNQATTAYQTAVALGSVGQFGAPVDMTKQKAVTINIVQSDPKQKCDSGCYQFPNVKVKVGTVITWVNKSNVGHTVSAIYGESTGSPKLAAQIFDSKLSNLIQSGQSFTYTVAAATFNFNPDHAVVYYCQVHANYMFAELTIVQ